MSASDLVSKKTRLEFREHFVGWTLRTIADEFDAADIACDLNYDPDLTGERRTLVEQYYHTLDFSNSNDVKRLLNVYAEVLRCIEVASVDEDSWGNSEQSRGSAKKELAKLTVLLKRDGWLYDDGLIRPAAGDPNFGNLLEHAVAFDLGHIRKQIERLENSVDSDPTHAIGTAKELVESCCKTILKDEGVEYDKKLDLMPLVKLTAKQLKLTPEHVPDAARGAKTIKTVLQKLTAIVHDMGELRNLYGSGHGKDGRFSGLQPRHARLVTGMASTLALFLFETHTERTAAEDNK